MQMTNDKDLAIVIPAVKRKFLAAALDAIAAQTCYRFHVYVGDDNSPENLYNVVQPYKEQFPLTYHQFPDNIGSRSVVEHWHRCIQLTKGENWIWVFSDDDLMCPDCVQAFYDAVESTKSLFDLYRFNCQIIDMEGKAVTEVSRYPTLQSSSEFLNGRLRYEFHSYIVNCVFSRRVYEKYKGFVDLEAAWGSDDATWTLYGQEKGIYTLEKGLVQWRTSSLNISGNRHDPRNRQLKYQGTAQFLIWAYDWARRNNVALDDKMVMRWYLTMLHCIGYRNRFWPYIGGRPFRTIFWRKSPVFQYRLLTQAQ